MLGRVDRGDLVDPYGVAEEIKVVNKRGQMRVTDKISSVGPGLVFLSAYLLGAGFTTLYT